MLSPRSNGARWMLTLMRARIEVRSLMSWSDSSGGRSLIQSVRWKNPDSSDSTWSIDGSRASMLHGHTRSFVDGRPGILANARSSNRNGSPGRRISAIRRSRCSRSRRVAWHSSIARICAVRLLHRALSVLTAVSLSVSLMVTVSVLTVLVLRLTDSSLPAASSL